MTGVGASLTTLANVGAAAWAAQAAGGAVLSGAGSTGFQVIRAAAGEGEFSKKELLYTMAIGAFGTTAMKSLMNVARPLALVGGGASVAMGVKEAGEGRRATAAMLVAGGLLSTYLGVRGLVARGKAQDSTGRDTIPLGERFRRFFGVYPDAADPTRQEVLIRRFLSRHEGVSQELAEGLARPYGGIGSHFIPDRWLKRPGVRRVLRALRISQKVENALAIKKPEGISWGEMFELHYRVDKSFHGAAFGPRSRFKWRGSEFVGADAKLGPVGSLWFASPTWVKIGVGAGLGYAAYEAIDDD